MIEPTPPLLAPSATAPVPLDAPPHQDTPKDNTAPSSALLMSAASPTTAGGMLRRARQARGMHIATLAASIKVAPRKLELLEADKFDQLTDATFTRALAQAMCRSLKIDAAPVLALLPPPNGHRLEQVSEGLKTPFRDRADASNAKEWAALANPMLWMAGLIVLAALAVYFLPSKWLPLSGKSAAQAAPAGVSTTVVTEPLAASTVLLAPPAASQPVVVFSPAIRSTISPKP
jgi:cytoskeleton protein RodZ